MGENLDCLAQINTGTVLVVGTKKQVIQSSSIVNLVLFQTLARLIFEKLTLITFVVRLLLFIRFLCKTSFILNNVKILFYFLCIIIYTE